MSEKIYNYGRILYQREGNFSQNTRLNEEVAGSFMEKAKLYPFITILDSDEKPEENTVSVGADVLAFKSVAPIDILNTKLLKGTPTYRIMEKSSRPRSYSILVKEREIDQKVRKGGYIDRTDFQDKFLAQLNEASSSALGKILFREKLSFKQNGGFYWFEGMVLAIPYLPPDINHLNPFEQLPFYLKENIIWNTIMNALVFIFSRSLYNDRNIAQALFYPLMPIEDYVKGQLYLKNKSLIVQRDSSAE